MRAGLQPAALPTELQNRMAGGSIEARPSPHLAAKPVHCSAFWGLGSNQRALRPKRSRDASNPPQSFGSWNRTNGSQGQSLTGLPADHPEMNLRAKRRIRTDNLPRTRGVHVQLCLQGTVTTSQAPDSNRVPPAYEAGALPNVLARHGATSRTRTVDLPLTGRLLYPLS